MPNEVATQADVRKMNPHQLVVHRMPEIARALPAHIPSEKFQRVFEMAVMRDPNILKCNPRSVLESVQKCAADGLVLDGREAALVIFKDRASYIPMVGGLLKRARNSGEIASLHAALVYQGEVDQGLFKIQFGTNPEIVHQPLIVGDRGQVVGVYSVARLKDGSVSIEFMRRDEVDAIRKRSRSSGNGPWVTDWNEMAKKTVLRRHTKTLPMDSDAARAFQRIDELYDLAPPPGATKVRGGARAALQQSDEIPERDVNDDVEDADYREEPHMTTAREASERVTPLRDEGEDDLPI